MFQDEFYEIIIQCPSDNTENLAAALIKTNVIDWTKPIIVPFAPHNVMECIKKVIQVLHVEIKLILPSESFILDRQTTCQDVK